MAHFPPPLCMSLSSEQGPVGRGCGREGRTGGPGQSQGGPCCRFHPAPSHTPRRLLACPQGPDPRVEATSIYSPSVPPQVTSLGCPAASHLPSHQLSVPGLPMPLQPPGLLGWKGAEVRLPWPGLSVGNHFPWFIRGLGPPPSVLPGTGCGPESRGWRRAHGFGLCFHKCLARWWVRRVTVFVGNIVVFGHGGFEGVFSHNSPPALAPGLGFAAPHHPQPLEKTYSRRTPAAGVGEADGEGAPCAPCRESVCTRALCTRLHNKRT